MMRALFGLVSVSCTVGIAWGQIAPPIPDRYGVAADPEAYPQATPQAALASSIRAISRGRIDYFAAHLLDPALVDAGVTARAERLEPAIEQEFRLLRDQQRLTTVTGTRLPATAAGLTAAIQTEAVRRAFRIFLQDIRDNLAENPDYLRDLQRFSREGQFSESDDTATATIPEFKDRAVYFKRTPYGWVVLDQRQEPAAR
jgi:hypothetical protein